MTPTPTTTTEYAQPSETMIDNIRQRLAQGPAGLVERVDEALRHKSIEYVGNYLWKIGCPFSSGELYEYRKTLFPPNSMLDPYTADAPTVRGGSAPNPEPQTLNPEPPPPTDDAAHATHATDITQVTDVTHATDVTHSPPPSPASLLNDLRHVINRYVVLPPMAAEALALWIVHTYAFTLRQVTTYIGVVSPEKRCGKTTLLELLALLANRSLTAANISPSALFRVIEQTKPTLLIDEADTFLQGRDELAGILNAGYRQGNSYVVRVADRTKPRRNPPTPDTSGGTSYTSPTPDPIPTSDPSDPPHSTQSPDSTQLTPPSHPSTNPHSRAPSQFGEWTNARPDGSQGDTEFAKYSCWCPKVMAAIGRLPDTLADRCIVITMQRKMPGEKCERMRQLNAAEYRLRCADFVRQNSAQIARAHPEIPSTLNDRAADIWEPLLAIADLAGGDWPQLARQAAQQLSSSDEEITLLGYFLKDIRTLMLKNNLDRVLSRDIIRVLNVMHDRPWEDLRRGREINEWWLGWQMRELGIRTKTMRVKNELGKGYLLDEIDAAFRRYVPNAGINGAED